MPARTSGGGSRKGATSGTGGKGRRKLAGRGATPPAEARPGHPAQRRAASAARAQPRPGAAAQGPERGAADRSGARADRTAPTGGGRRGGPPGGSSESARHEAPARRGPKSGVELPETIGGRNAVAEALRARVPAIAVYVATGIDGDERVTEALRLAGRRNIPILEATRTELDRLTAGSVHQGLALQVPAYTYAHPDDLLTRATEAATPALVVALDGVTDPRNLGAVLRSAAAFGAHGVLVPERRSAGVTAAAWKTSAGAAARIPVARATNLVRALKSYADAGLLVVGLAADGELPLDGLEAAVDPIVLVVGSEGKGLSRLVGETCDLTVRIPMAGGTESLNAGVAAGVALYEVARRR